MAEYPRPPSSAITLAQPTSDEDEEAGGPHPGSGGKALASPSSSGSKKPRGRPPGSKNKPKPPVVITRESEAAMQPVVLEVAPGCDVLDCLAAFARRRRLGLSVLGATGSVANVALRHPASSSSHAATITLHGRFDLLSLAGTFLPAHTTPPGSSSSSSCCPFTISLAGSQGQVIGGTVAGPLTAAGSVVVVAATFTTPEYHHLPEEDAEAADATKEEDVKPSVTEIYQVPGQLAHEMVLWASPPPPPPSSSRGPPHHY